MAAAAARSAMKPQLDRRRKEVQEWRCLARSSVSTRRTSWSDEEDFIFSNLFLKICRSALGSILIRENWRLLKMEEMVGSAIVHETVNKIISGLIDRCERKSSAEEHLERLEMAQIKLEFALETSNKWQITSAPLLRWQKKLKRAAEECDDTLRKCRQRIQEEEEAEQQVRNNSFPRRIALATKSLISSILNGNIDEIARSAGNKQHLLWIWPNKTAEQGIEVKLCFAYDDDSAPEDNFVFTIMLQLSESTNIFGTIIKCLQLFAPHFESTIETVKKKLTQLPTQDFSRVPHSRSYEDLFPAVESTVIEVINGNEQHCLHTNVPLEHMEEIMLPRAVNCFRQNVKATAYQILWKSKHGGAYLQAVKATMNMARARRTIQGVRKIKMLRQPDRRKHSRTNEVANFLKLVTELAPVQLQGSILDWIRKEKKVPSPLLRLTSERLLKMEEMVGSAIVHETVNKIISGLIDRCEQKSSAEDHLERLEMAQIKLELALETSNKWQITSAPLLRWQKKLKRAAEECDDTLRKCRQRIQEEEEAEEQVKNYLFPRRVACATKSLVSSILNGNIKEPTTSAVRRFEWFANGANEFLRSVEFGGTPRRYLFFDPLIGHLLGGETLEYKSVQGNKQHWFLIRPNNTADRGIEATLIFFYDDDSAPEDNFYLEMMLQLSHSTNIVGTAIKCLQLFTSHFESTADTVRKELTQLPTQDFSRVPHSRSYGWENLNSIITECCRPNPLCCKHHGQKECGSGNMDMIELPEVYLEPVICVHLLCQVSLSRIREQGTIVEHKSSPNEFPRLYIVLSYSPHLSIEDLLPAVENTLIEVINGNEQHTLHTNIALEQMAVVMLLRAVDCFRQNEKATVYQMRWNSKHGGVYLQAVKAIMNMPSTWRTNHGARKAKMLRRHGHRTQSRRNEVADFLKLAAPYVPVQLQVPLLNWIQKGEIQSNRQGLPYVLGFFFCVGDAMSWISTFLIG
uniref:Uncharacterized protein n=1 Tax=Leersia perrieri TaxID=77586 RepID=A0A0D9WV12_9ORYZ